MTQRYAGRATITTRAPARVNRAQWAPTRRTAVRTTARLVQGTRRLTTRPPPTPTTAKVTVTVGRMGKGERGKGDMKGGHRKETTLRAPLSGTFLHTLRAPLSGTFLQTLPDLVTPLKGYSLSPRSCPATRSAPSERFRC